MSDAGASLLRLEIFAGVFVLLAICEMAWPLQQTPARRLRWPANLGLSILNSALLRLLVLVMPGVALVAAARAAEGFGVLQQVGLSGAVLQVVGFLVLDAAVYAQHRLFHAMPIFWRFHQVHHADMTLDVSSAVRFHTGEILISQAWKLGVVVAAGVPAEAALAFEIVLNASSMFSHANVALWPPLERLARVVVVTPDMHRIHHSVRDDEMNSNFGFNFSIWDRLFGTYVATPARPAADMELGLAGVRGRSTFDVAWLLAMPFRGGSSQ